MENQTSAHQPSSQNALKHGCCALEFLILPDENIAAFRTLEKSLRTAYDTPTEWELDLLNHAIESEWFHIRATTAYARFEAALYRAAPDPSEWSDAQHRNLGRFLRYKTKHANTVAAYLKRLEAFKRPARTPSTLQPLAPAPLGKSEKMARLDALAEHGLVRWQDLDGVFLTPEPAAKNQNETIGTVPSPMDCPFTP